MLFGFIVTFLGAAIGAGVGALTGSLEHVGIDEQFIEGMRYRATPRTSALLAMTNGAPIVGDRILSVGLRAEHGHGTD